MPVDQTCVLCLVLHIKIDFDTQAKNRDLKKYWEYEIVQLCPYKRNKQVYVNIKFYPYFSAMNANLFKGHELRI